MIKYLNGKISKEDWEEYKLYVIKRALHVTEDFTKIRFNQMFFKLK